MGMIGIQVVEFGAFDSLGMDTDDDIYIDDVDVSSNVAPVDGSLAIYGKFVQSVACRYYLKG